MGSARFCAALLGGVGVAVAYEPWNQHWMLPLGVAAFIVAVRGPSLQRAFTLGIVGGLAYVLTLAVWLRVVGVDAWLVVSLVAAVFYGALAVGLTATRRLPCWPIWAACLWTTTETAMSSVPFGGFPWPRLVWATADTPYAAWLPWVGASGVTFLVALTGAGLAWLPEARKRPHALTALGAMLGLLGVPLAEQPVSLGRAWSDSADARTVAIVQGGVPGTGDDVAGVHRQVTAGLVSQTLDLSDRIRRGELTRPDLVLWPENSTAVDPFKDLEIRAGISSAATELGTPILLGAIVDGEYPEEVLNQGIVWTSMGPTRERYTKRHPVPFGEYLPFRRFLTDLEIGRLEMIPRDMRRGEPSEPLRIAGFAIGVLICFDIAFDDVLMEHVRSGAQVLTVQTSNAMFINTSQPSQQFAITRLRAMETGRAVAVASVNGVSGVVAPDGSVVRSIGSRGAGDIVVDIPLIDRVTPAATIGRPLRDVISFLALVACIWAVSARRRRGWGEGAARDVARADRAVQPVGVVQ